MRPPALFSIIVVAAALLVAASPTAAQFPAEMNYQVMLTNDLDEPLSDQSVELVFRVFNVESGGAAIWTETHNTTTNSIGVVSVILGSTNPLPFEAWPGLTWLEIEVNGEILSPRRELTSAPYAFEAFSSRRLGGLSSIDVATVEELSTPGTINNSSNPVDWTKLKSVPAGFADGTDDVGGSGDGHSLDAWDGDPVDAVWVAGNGKVGIGITDPSATMHVHNDTLSSTAIRLTTPESGTTATDGFVMSLSPFGGGALLSNYEGAPIYIGSGGASGLTIRSDSSVDIGNGVSQPGELSIYGSTSYIAPLHRSYEDADGGQFRLTDEAENVAVLYGADDSGTGGRLQISRDAAYGVDKGIDLNGNWGGAEAPALRIMGSSRSARFYMGEEGNSSVQLPQDAISGFEMMDEPGVANTSSGSDMAVAGGGTYLASRSIVVPNSGYVLAMAACEAKAAHTYGTYTDMDIGISHNDINLPSTQAARLQVPGTAPTGTYYFPVSCHGLFEVGSAGTYTYDLIAWLFAGSVTIDDMKLTLVYLPTAYGDVVPTTPSNARFDRDDDTETRAPLTQAERAAERAEAEAFNLARVERELTEIQAQVEAMKEER